MQIGSVFHGKYKILGQIGKGGMGEVYLAENTSLGTKWAIKRIYKNPNSPINLMAEANLMKNLNHPSIVRIFDIVEDYYNIYIIEDYIEGTSLEKYVNNGQRFDEPTVIAWGKQICDALHYRHNQNPPIIYRDMKPSNLMIDQNWNVTIIDFGIAREFKEESQGDTVGLGTMGYAAPEQISGLSQSDGRTDIYSLGVTIYHLVTGHNPNTPPYEILPIRQIDPTLSTGLEYIIQKCIQKNPDNRYQTVEELAFDLHHIYLFDHEYKRQVTARKLKVTASILGIGASIFLTVSGVTGIFQARIDNYNSMITQGVELAEGRQYNDAIAVFEEAAVKISSEVQAYKEKAKLLLTMGEYDVCIQYIEKDAFGKNSAILDDEDILYILGTAYFENKDYRNAIIKFKKASELNNTSVPYLRDLAVSYARDEQIVKASEILSKIQERGMDEDTTWYVNAEIQSVKKEFSDAISSFEKTISVTKDEELRRKSFIAIAEIYKYNKNQLGIDAVDKQIAILERATTELQDKNNLVITEMLAEAYYDKGFNSADNKTQYYVKSIELFNHLIQSGYERPYIYRNIAILYQQINDYTNCEQVLSKMKELYPEDYTCYIQFALLYAEIENSKNVDNRDYSKTNEYYNLAVQYSPQGKSDAALMQLNSLIDELKDKKWIK